MNIASLRSVHTPHELEALAPLDEIRETLEHELSPLQFHAGSYDEMYKVVAKLQYHWDSLQKDAYFKNENSRYIFALLYMEPKERDSVIGWDSSFYNDKDKAKKWYLSLVGKVHPDHNLENKEDAEKAFEELNYMYKDISWADKDSQKEKGG